MEKGLTANLNKRGKIQENGAQLQENGLKGCYMKVNFPNLIFKLDSLCLTFFSLINSGFTILILAIKLGYEANLCGSQYATSIICKLRIFVGL